MADYVLPDVVEKRVRYFDGQFLQDQDFIDEQNYQRDREHRHSRLLHGPGVVEGLAVTSAAPNQVTVAPGTAIDSDGNQLVLAQATVVGLPAADFDDKQGVQVYISYLVSAEDQQTVGGSSDFTRWLERPQLTALAPGDTYSGTAPPVLLASLALDNAGRVTVDGSVRSYSGLLLPGPGADPAALRATSGGTVHLSGGLTVDGHVGIAQNNPAYDLEIGNYEPQDRFMAFRVDGGNAHISGIKFWTWQDNYGYSLQYDERTAPGNGLHIKSHNIDPNGVSRLFVDWGTGNLGIGTTTPGARLEVVGGGGDSVDLLVNGRIRSNNNDGGLWVMADRFIGGFGASNVGFWTGGQWRFTVQPDGHVGIAQNSPAYDLEIGNYDQQDRFMALKVAGGNAHVSGIKFWTWQDNYGYSLQYDERMPANGLHVKTHNKDPNGTTRLFVDWFTGGVGIGTTTTSNQALKVAGSTWIDGNLFVGGTLILKTGPTNWSAVGARQTSGLDSTQWMFLAAEVSAPSDLRLKTDLRPVGHALDAVRQLQAVRYRWGDDGLRYLTSDISDGVCAGPGATPEQDQAAREERAAEARAQLGGDRLGLIAQDVEAVLPELVREDASGYKHIRYQHLTALLAEAIKELSAQVEALAGGRP